MIGNTSELHLLSFPASPSESAKILCGPTTKLLLENIHHIYINFLHFVGCGENKIESVNQLIINNSIFRGLPQDTSGTALDLVHTNAKIINSSFLYNLGSYRGPIRLQLPYLILQQPIPPQSAYALVGGALIVNCSNMSAVGSKFEGNSAEIGGAIFSQGSSNIIKLTDCSLINNHAFSFSNLGFGGAIFSETGSMRASTTLVDTNFFNNTAQNEGAASFIRIEIFRCTFTTNLALLGGVLVVINCNANIYDSNFNSNDAHEAGVICAYSDTFINITKSRFFSNTASSGAGGVLLAFEFTHMTITESTFYNNSAQLDGGVVFMTTVCNLIILRCQFNNNKASKGGVVSAMFQSNVTILDSDFNNNTAYESGGVVSIHEVAMLHITNSSFRECTAKWGGVLTQRETTLAIVSNCSFHHNLATKKGGVFFSMNISQITLIGCNFTDNRAVLGGVGTAELQCNVIIIHSSAFNNVASHQGGAIYAADDCFIHTKRCQFAGGVVFVSNHSNVYISNTQFSFNLAVRGGVIDLNNWANATITNCNFSENSGTNNGGAISLVSGSTLTLKHTIFKNNDGQYYGGAIST